MQILKTDKGSFCLSFITTFFIYWIY